MGTYRVTDPSGKIYEIEAPDNATEEQIFEMAAKQSGLAPGTPQIKGPDIVMPAGLQQRVLAGTAQGLARVGDNAADLLEGAYNQTAGRMFGESTSADNPAFSDAAAQLGVGDETARMAGEIGGAALLTRGMGGPGMQGAGAGALLSNADDAPGTAFDAALGFAGGKIAEPIIRGFGNLVSPAVDESARMLRQIGTKLTPGQAVPALKALEDKMMSWPFVGDVIQEGRKASFESFNRAVMDDILKPIGQALPETIKTGNKAIKWVGDKLSDAYETLIPKLVLRADDQLVSEVQTIGQSLRTGELSPSTQRKFEAMVRDGVMSRMKGPYANGEQYRAADKYLTNKIARYGASTAPEDQALAEALRELQGSLSGALARSNPAAAAELEALNRGWSLLVPAESAGAMAKRGIFSAEQFRAAVRQNNKTVRKRGMARGEARGQDLAEAGSEILPSNYPDSGTAGREAMSLANPQFWQGLAAKQFYGPRTQNALAEVALFPRPSFADPVAEFIKRVPPAPVGAAVGVNALAPPRQ